MPSRSVAAFIEEVQKYALLTAEQQQELARQLRSRHSDPHHLARDLVERGWLTPYQINQLMQGHGKELVLGSYILLERLGEGGMGRVYKARHKKLDRLVALKLIRQNMVADAEAVQRFRQEIEAAAQLSHPNIVMAFDADTIGGICFYTMEYVEGTTLSNLVRRSGPMMVSLACEYVRQAALGLQHAHERGLVHRDIKPSNLILTWTSKPSDPTAGGAAEKHSRELWGTHMPVIKVFDMGLARLNSSHEIDPRDLGSITEKGALMGTPDYMSVEQAMNAHKADIRSDLYSLGATFYHLLAGDVPFPGGTPLEKVIRHKMEEPRPISQLRTGVPTEVQAIVHKLMAKDPANRYQVPADLAHVLSVVLKQHEQSGRKAGGSKR